MYDILSLAMLVKVNNIDIDKNKVRVSKLDIDDYGSVIARTKLELRYQQMITSLFKHCKTLLLLPFLPKEILMITIAK